MQRKIDKDMRFFFSQSNSYLAYSPVNQTAAKNTQTDRKIRACEKRGGIVLYKNKDLKNERMFYMHQSRDAKIYNL